MKRSTGAEREREVRPGTEVSRTQPNEKKGHEWGWFREINPLMLDVHAPTGTMSASSYTRGISII